MNSKVDIIIPLLEKVEQLLKTSIELFKLKTIYKSSEIISVLSYKLILISCTMVFIFFVNIALALWIGEKMGKNYFGFLILAGFYGLISIILLIAGSKIKSGINNSLISNMLK
jgi:hypothetical protein